MHSTKVFTSLTATARAVDVDSRKFAQLAVAHGIKPVAFLREGAAKPLTPLFDADAIIAMRQRLEHTPKVELRHIGPAEIASHLAPAGNLDF